MKKTYLIFIFSIVFGCGKGSNYLKIDAVQGKFDLSNQISGDWETVCFFPPYSTNESAREILGFEYDIEAGSDINLSDGITLLLILKNNAVVRKFEVSRRNVDFSSLGTICYAKENTEFQIPKVGWPKVSHT